METITTNFSSEMHHYNVMRDYIDRLLNTHPITNILSEREINILKKRYIHNTTMEELGCKYNLNKSTISRIIIGAQRKINHHIQRLSDIQKKYKETISENRIMKYKMDEMEKYVEKVTDDEKKIKKIKELKIQFKEYEHLIGYEIKDLDLSARCYNCLKSARLYSTIDIIIYCKKHGFDRLLIFRNFGKNSSNELRNVILKKFDIDILILK